MIREGKTIKIDFEIISIYFLLAYPVFGNVRIPIHRIMDSVRLFVGLVTWRLYITNTLIPGISIFSKINGVSLPISSVCFSASRRYFLLLHTKCKNKTLLPSVTNRQIKSWK